jgi:hypothetical protein
MALVMVLATAAIAADSLNCHLVGNWPFGPSSNAAADPGRNIVFCDAGGRLAAVRETGASGRMVLDELADGVYVVRAGDLTGRLTISR